MNTIIVTGAAGFIGMHVAKALLERGDNVIGIDNLNDYYDVSLKEARLKQLATYPKFSFYKEDITNKDAIFDVFKNHSTTIKGVIHLAAQAGVRHSIENPFIYITSNVLGHTIMIDATRHHAPNCQHFVYASSSSVYGGNKNSPFSINDVVDTPISLYAATKKADELITHAYSHLFNMATTGLRFFTVYGPWGRPDMAAFLFADAIVAGNPINVFNNGHMKRDFTYIDDVVSGILKTLDSPPAKNANGIRNRVLNIGNHRSEQLMDYIGEIEKALGQTAIKNMLPIQAGDVPETFADIEETTKETGFIPTTTIAEGIPKFIEWYKSYYNIKDLDNEKETALCC